MFGYPFITTLVLAVVGVTIFSLVRNKGIAKKSSNTTVDTSPAKAE